MTDSLCTPTEHVAGASDGNAGGRAEGGRYRRECAPRGRHSQADWTECRRPTLLARLRSWPASVACRPLSCSAGSSSCTWGRCTTQSSEFRVYSSLPTANRLSWPYKPRLASSAAVPHGGAELGRFHLAPRKAHHLISAVGLVGLERSRFGAHLLPEHFIVD